VITNREIRNERLLDEALQEVTESALANDVDGDRVAATLRERAAEIADDREGNR